MQDFLVGQKLLDKAVPVETLFTTELVGKANEFDLAAVLKRAEAMK
jgi:hypothetical protein